MDCQRECYLMTSNLQQKYQRNRWGYFFKQLGISLGFLFTVGSGMLGILNFKDIINISFELSIIIFLIFILACLSYSIIRVVSQLNNEPISVKIDYPNNLNKPELQDELELINVVKKHHIENDHKEVVRLCSNLSRALWISGQYRQRIVLGAFYEDSAQRIEEFEEQISALIDDLGWTNAVVGNIKVAKENINKGIKIAEDKENNYLLAKGFRHLGTIELRYTHDSKKSIENFSKALTLCNQIDSDVKKKEMIANISYNMSEAYLLDNDYNNANTYADTAENLFIELNDKIRSIKVKSHKARILTARRDGNDIEIAKALITQALAEARKEKRTDEIGKCLLCLGEIQVINNQKELAINTLKEALNVFTSIGAIAEINTTNSLLGNANYQSLNS